ncbi:MAG TPA: hypothetical protein VF809_01945 [Candidatus Saccharimonadales bacterium]
MVPLLYRVSLSTTFGRKSAHPFRSAILRITLMELSAVTLGWMLGNSLRSIALPISELQLAAKLIFALQISTILGLFSASGLIHSHNALGRQLLLLPVTTRERLTVMLIPPAILTCTVVTLVGIPLGIIASGSGMPLLALLAIGVMGGSVGLATFFCMPSKRLWLGMVALAPILGVQYNLVAQIDKQLLALVAVALIWAVPCIIFIWRRSRIPFEIAYKPANSAVKFPAVFKRSWFIKKILRSPIARVNLPTTVLLAAGFAIFAAHNPLYRFACLPLGSFLIAAGVSDLRALSREINPPEATALRGTAYFFMHHAFGGIIVAAAVMPLLSLGQSELLQLCAYLIIAVSSGIFAGTVIVPASHDISGQIVATLLCVAILAAPSYLPFLAVLGCWGAVFMSLALVSTAYCIEYRRNKYTWSHYVS